MISKSISTSTTLAEVSDFAKLLFTWIIPHCDDYGHMDGSARIVKGIVVPLCEATTETVEEALKEIEKVNLIKRYEVEGKLYLEIVKWDDHQTLKSDRPVNIQYPLPPSWKNLDSKRNFENSKRKNKLSEVKLSEAKIYERLSYLSKIPKEDMDEFTKRFKVGEEVINDKAEDLRLYCESKGRVYKNYRAFLLGALRRDIKAPATKLGGKYDQIKVKKV